MYLVTKTYGHERGLSCCFRQWRASSHCNKLHGYALSFEFIFEAETLDERNWVIDFGGLNFIKDFLTDTFDHKTVIAKDDPYLPEMMQLSKMGVVDLLIIEAVGCEKFAEYVFSKISSLVLEKTNNRVKLKSVKVSEHGSNSASYLG